MDIDDHRFESFWSADHIVTLEERVYRFLHEMIVNGHAVPGSTIVGSQLATRLGVSRITVANALRRLSSEGFVIVHPHRGAVIASLDVPTLNEIFRIRYALESEVVAELALRLDREGLDRLRYLDHDVRDSLLRHDTNAYRQLERRFHLLVYELAALPMMCSMLTDLWNRLEPYRGRRYSSQLLVQDAIDDHQHVLAALEGRDVDSAVAAMRAHVERGHRQLLHVLEPQGTGTERPSPHSGHYRPLPRSSRPDVPPSGSLRDALSSLPDNRRGQGRMYRKGDILTLAICAMLCGARSQYAIAAWVAESPPPVRTALGWRHGRIPSGPTIHRVMAGLEPGEMETVLRAWLDRHGLTIPAAGATTGKRGVHGERPPAVELIERMTDVLRGHLRQADSPRDPGMRSPWSRFFGRILYGTGLPSDIPPAELQLRRAFLHTAGSDAT